MTQQSAGSRAVGRIPLSVHLIALLALFGVIAAAGALYQRHVSFAAADRRSATAIAFRAQLAATEVDKAIALTRSAVHDLAAKPALRVLFNRGAGDCTLAFSGAEPFTAGHIDMIDNAGAVICSSKRIPTTALYADAPWLVKATTGASVDGSVLDPATDSRAIVVSAPVQGLGVVATFLDLDGVTASFANRLGGPVAASFALTSDAPPAGSAARPGDPRNAGAPVASIGWWVQASSPRTQAQIDAATLSDHLIWYLIIAFLVLLLAVHAVYIRVARPIRRVKSRVVV